MNTQQIRWAKQHDWFLEAVQQAPNVHLCVVRDYKHHGADEWEPVAVTFDSFTELRAWAGY